MMKKCIVALLAFVVMFSFVADGGYALAQTISPTNGQPTQEPSKPVPNEQPVQNLDVTTYTVRFFDWDNTLLGPEQIITENEAAVAPEVPNREGYKFTGWSADFSSVTQNMDIYAQYEQLVSYTVTINYIFADNTIALQPVIYSVGSGEDLNQTVPTPSIPGYTPDQAQVVIALTNVQQAYDYTVVFTPASDTAYKVQHYQQNLVLTNTSNPMDPVNFSLVDTDNLTGQTGALVNAVAKTYTGFSAPTTMPSAQIAADNSTTLKVYYTRMEYAVYYDSAGGSYVAPQAIPYGGTITPPANPTRQGYAFTGWSSSIPATMPAQDLTFTASWTPAGQSTYTLVYWLENIDSSGYDYVGTAGSSGSAGATPVVPGSIPSGVNFPIANTYFTLNGIKTTAEKPTSINGDGTTIVNVYYDRNAYTLNFKFNASKYKLVVGSTTYTTSPYQLTAKYGASINAKWPTAPTLLPGKTGDGTFIGWSGGNIEYVTTQFFLDSSLINNNPFTATWNPSSKNVTVYYYFQNLVGGGFTPNYTQSVAVDTNATSWNAKSFVGFTVQQSTVSIQNNTATFYYDRNHYNVTYYNNGVIDKTISNVAYQDSISGTNYNYTPPRPTNIPADYTFSGWYKTAQGFAGSQFNFTGATMPAYNLILYAKWDKPTYTVTFNPDNGSATFSQAVTAQGVATEPTPPTKPGYIFGGWYLPGSSVKYVFNFPVTSNLNLTARWIPVSNITYDVIYMKDGAEYLHQTFGSKSINDVVTASAITIPGYLPDAVSKSLTLQATGNVITFYYTPFTNVNYTVKYVDTNNVPLHADKIASSNQASVSESYINIPGYFPNYYQQTLQLTPVAADNVMTFVYTKNAPVDYKVRTYFENIGGGYTMSEVTKSAPAGSLAQELPQTYTGFTFMPGLSIISRVVATNGSTVLYLFYNRDAYDITFDTQGSGTLLGQTSFDNVKYETPFSAAGTLPSPIPAPGYKFDGWQPTLPDASSLVTASANYTAVFSKDETQWATITFDGNTSTSGSMNNSGDLLIGSTYVLPLNAYSKTNFTYVNWDTQPNGTGSAFINGEPITVTNDMTLYAQWTENERFSVSYINNGGIGSITDSNIYHDGDVVTVLPNTLVKPGYTFAGFKTPADVTYNPNATFSIHENTLLIAQWQYDATQWVTLKYDKNNPLAQGVMADETLLVGNVHSLVNNGYTLNHYTFNGWNTQADSGGTNYANGQAFTPATDGTITLYAQWIEDAKYNINYYANNTTPDMVSDTTDYVGTMKSIYPDTTFTYEHHFFTRWNTAPDGSGDSYLPGDNIPLTKNLDLYAIWKASNLYVITYNDGFSTGTFTDSEYGDVNGDVDIIVANNPFVHIGYEFKDWISTTSTIAYPMDVIYNVHENITFTAEWTPIVYNIGYDLNGGTVNGLNPTQYTIETPTFELINPTKPGYQFVGWTKDVQPPLDHMFVNQGSTGDILFTANFVRDDTQWSKITFINSDPSKGTLGGTLTYEGIKGEPTAGQVAYPNAASADGYQLDQWSSPIPATYPLQDMVIIAYWKDTTVVVDPTNPSLVNTGNDTWLLLPLALMSIGIMAVGLDQLLKRNKRK